jgi:hypothetical protein
MAKGRMKAIALILMAGLLAACTTHSVPTADVRPPSKTDPLQEPSAVKSEALQFGEDPPDAFAPILSGPGPYPTQHEAFHALQRSNKYPGVSSLRLFACARGYIDEFTKRRRSIDAPVVHCATDLYSGRVRQRVALNFYYYEKKWQLQDPGVFYTTPNWKLPDTNIKTKARRKDRT